ncbi:hypothetical protein CRE_17677 [Caenorhabditis remanei]|uniref:Serpentine receptor class r-10 n=1 Tax=Caenorhabditis remanei TaxID=31234 RepID=E3NPX1_CAERE|nr:hypothetical protein CRE_17677 [Caenorhabditis remanei]
MQTFSNVKTTIQICSVLLSIFVNSISICLIITKSPKIMGTYRHLMIYFCSCSIIFSLCDAVIQPNIQTYKSAFFMVVDVKNRHLITPWIAELFIELLCGCIGVTVYTIAVHFIYRLLALERQGRLKYFNNQFLFVWFSIPFLAGVIWFAVTKFVFGMNPLVTNYIRNTVEEFFNLKTEDCVYGAAVFYPIDENGQQFVSWKAFFGLSCYMTLLTIPFVTILVCGVKSFKKIRSLLDHGESEFARNLQMQLYKALIAQVALFFCFITFSNKSSNLQTVIPVFFFFIPFGFIFILPIFEIDCHFLGAPITLVIAMYPAIDPLPTLFFVDYYRIAIFEVFNVCKCKKARIEGASDESVSRGYPNTV